MCDTHLVPDVDELRKAVESFCCAECDELVPVGAEYRHIEGATDDGKPGRVRYRAHDECYQAEVQDGPEEPENDGCFQYGRVELIA